MIMSRMLNVFSHILFPQMRIFLTLIESSLKGMKCALRIPVFHFSEACSENWIMGMHFFFELTVLLPYASIQKHKFLTF